MAHDFPVEEVHKAAQDTYPICQGVVTLTETKSQLSMYRNPHTASKFCAGYPVYHQKFLQEALDDMDRLTRNITHLISPSDASGYSSTMNEIIDLYYLIAEGSTPSSLLEQKIITFLHFGRFLI